MQFFNRTMIYVIIPMFIIICRFVLVHVRIGKDYACIVLDRGEGLHIFLKPFEGLLCDPSYVCVISLNHFQPSSEYKFDPSMGRMIT